MFDKNILNVKKMRRLFLVLLLSGASLAVQADRKDSLRNYDYF